MNEKEKYYCSKCGKTMDENSFFTYKDGTKTELCKKCLTMHIDNFDESTYLWLLEKMDVPYVPEEWNTLRDRIYEKDPTKLTSQSVFGRYLSKMKLKQWRAYGWADTEKLQQEYQEKAEMHAKEVAEREAEAKERYENGEISEAEYKTLIQTETKHRETPIQAAPQSPYAIGQTPMVPGSIPMNEQMYMSEDDMIDTAADLTEDDKIYLAMK